MKDAIYVCLDPRCKEESKKLVRTAYYTGTIDNLENNEKKIVYVCPKCLGIQFCVKGVPNGE